jgi:hypothetical protein
VVIKLVVKEPSENRRRRQLLPTPKHGKMEKEEFISDKSHNTELDKQSLATKYLTVK